MYKVWLERVDQEPTLLSSARKHGLTRLGYMSLKPEQLSAIDAILRGRDTFVSVPTGFGKSLVYQVLPFCADWLTGRVTGISTSSKPVVMASPVAYARPFVAVCLRLDGAVAHHARVYASAAHGS